METGYLIIEISSTKFFMSCQYFMLIISCLCTFCSVKLGCCKSKL